MGLISKITGIKMGDSIEKNFTIESFEKESWRIGLRKCSSMDLVWNEDMNELE